MPPGSGEGATRSVAPREVVTAAHAIQVAIESGEEIGCLTQAEKGAVLLASDQHPATLNDLCDRLARDLLDRDLLDRD